MARTATRVLMAVALAASVSFGRVEAQKHGGAPPHWSFAGADGPAHCGELSPAFALCGTGRSQSPIDISRPVPKHVGALTFHYRPGRLNIVNNGHAIQVNYDPGSYIELNGTRYDLQQFHFHAPSEHEIDGRRAAAELHLVNQSADGRLAVVGVLIDTGAGNPAFAPILDHLPAMPGPVRRFDTRISAAGLLPATRTTYRYRGSLTTPPCTEGVQWIVMTTPVTMSAAQLAALTRLYPDNSRPLQPLHGRVVVEDRPR